MQTDEFKCLMPSAIPPRPRCKQQCKTCESSEIRAQLLAAQERYNQYFMNLDETPE